MKSPVLVLCTCLLVGCASSGSKGGGNSGVRVYESVAPLTGQRAASLPDGCRFLESLPGYDQQESERSTDDPYKKERAQAAARGGNVLLVHSDVLVRRPNLECPSADQSPSCLAASRSWFHVSFESYTCPPAELQTLQARAEAATGPEPLLSWKLAGSPASNSAQIKAKVLAMMQEGVATATIETYVRGEKFKKKLTADEIIDWKRSGIPDSVIQIAAEK